MARYSGVSKKQALVADALNSDSKNARIRGGKGGYARESGEGDEHATGILTVMSHRRYRDAREGHGEVLVGVAHDTIGA